MKIEVWTAAERLRRDYGDQAETECASRASYHEIQGDKAAAENWRQIGTIIQRLRHGERPPG